MKIIFCVSTRISAFAEIAMTNMDLGVRQHVTCLVLATTLKFAVAFMPSAFIMVSYLLML